MSTQTDNIASPDRLQALTQPAVKPYREDIRNALTEYRNRHSLTLSALAGELATNATQVCKYLNGKPEGDVTRLERLIEDIIKNESRRKDSRNTIIETYITRIISATFETIRETNDVGLVFGPAGLGKTCGIELYASKNPTAILATAKTWRAGSRDMEGLIFHALSNRSWKPNTKRGDFLVDRMTGSNRLIIVDNAHKLRPSALGWLFDFHDATECPLALVGNPSVLDLIRSNDQWFSRIGLKRELRLNPSQSRKISEQLVGQIIPEAIEHLRGLAEQVVEHHGHFRALRKQVILARKIRENTPAETPWAMAFRSAHDQLVRDYALQ